MKLGGPQGHAEHLRKNIRPTGFRSTDRPASSESLYQLYYHSPYYYYYHFIPECCTCQTNWLLQIFKKLLFIITVKNKFMENVIRSLHCCLVDFNGEELSQYQISFSFFNLRHHSSCWQNYCYFSYCFLLSSLFNPIGHVMHQQFNIQQLYVLPTLCLCVLYLSENKQRLVPLTAQTDWFL